MGGVDCITSRANSVAKIADGEMAKLLLTAAAINTATLLSLFSHIK